jgi:hypothetical protein
MTNIGQAYYCILQLQGSNLTVAKHILQVPLFISDMSNNSGLISGAIDRSVKQLAHEKVPS